MVTVPRIVGDEVICAGVGTVRRLCPKTLATAEDQTDGSVSYRLCGWSTETELAERGSPTGSTDPVMATCRWRPMDEQVIAPLRKRWLADAVDALLLGFPLLPLLLRAPNRQRRLPGVLDVLSAFLSGAYQVSATALAGQTLGQRTLGIRVVDQRTGGVPTWRQAALRWLILAVPDGLSLLVRRFTTRKTEKAVAAMRDLEPEVHRLREQYGRDRQGLNEALIALYEERNVNPMEGCSRAMVDILPGLLARTFLSAPVLRGPLHQGFADRVCRTVVIDGGPEAG